MNAVNTDFYYHVIATITIITSIIQIERGRPGQVLRCAVFCLRHGCFRADGLGFRA